MGFKNGNPLHRGFVNGNSLDLGKAVGLMKSPTWGIWWIPPLSPNFLLRGIPKNVWNLIFFSRKKVLVPPGKFWRLIFYIDFFRVPPQKIILLFSPVFFFCPWHFRFWELSRPFCVYFHAQSKIVTDIFSQKCHARYHGQIYENQKMSRVLFVIVTGICAAGVKKRVYSAAVQGVAVLLFFYFCYGHL